MSHEQLVGMLLLLDPEFVSWQREVATCPCDCIMKKDPDYLIHKSSKKELINYLENSILNMNQNMNRQHKIIKDYDIDTKPPPTYGE